MMSPPVVPDYELLRQIGRSSYGDVWLARSVTGKWRAIKVVQRDRFDSDRPFEREFQGIHRFEFISHRHLSHLRIPHVGRNAAEGFFYYVMELADPVGAQSPDSYQHRQKADRAFRLEGLSAAHLALAIAQRYCGYYPPRSPALRVRHIPSVVSLQALLQVVRQPHIVSPHVSTALQDIDVVKHSAFAKASA